MNPTKQAFKVQYADGYAVSYFRTMEEVRNFLEVMEESSYGKYEVRGVPCELPQGEYYREGYDY